MYNLIYIRMFILFMAIALLCYCGVFIHLDCDNMVVILPDILLTDVLYYSSVTLSHFFGAISISFICKYIEDNNPNLKIATAAKYFIYGITLVLFWRACFHFWFYSKMHTCEIALDAASVVLIFLRWLYYFGLAKISINRWIRLKYR